MPTVCFIILTKICVSASRLAAKGNAEPAAAAAATVHAAAAAATGNADLPTEPAAVLAADEPPLYAGKTPREWSVLKRGAMHLLSSPSVRSHCGGIFNLISAWLLNGMIADAVDANPMVKIECFIFAQHLPAISKKDCDKELELQLSTSPYATGCHVMEVGDTLSAPNTRQGSDESFKELGLFWYPSFLAKPVDPDTSKNIEPLGRECLFNALDSSGTYPPSTGAPDLSAASSSSSSVGPSVAAGVGPPVTVHVAASDEPTVAARVGPLVTTAAMKPGDLTEEQKAQVLLGYDMYSHPDSFRLQNIVGFYHPKFRVDALEDHWRARGILDSRPLHELTAGVKLGFTLPEGLGFYIAPSNCPAYYANHFNKLAEEPNAEFTDHWAMQGPDFIPTFTFCLMATRKLEPGEQILVNYGTQFADLEPFVEEEESTEDADSPSPKQLKLTIVPATTGKTKKKPQPRIPKRKQPTSDDPATPVSNKKAPRGPGPGQSSSSGSAPNTP